MKKMSTLSWVAFILLVIGGINLGLYGLFKFDLLTGILGTFLSRILFILVGVAAGYKIWVVFFKKD